MATLTVRDVEEKTVRALKKRAARHARSLEAELREILRRAAADARLDFLAEAKRISALTPPGRRQTPGADLLRELRHERDGRPLRR